MFSITLSIFINHAHAQDKLQPLILVIWFYDRLHAAALYDYYHDTTATVYCFLLRDQQGFLFCNLHRRYRRR